MSPNADVSSVLDVPASTEHYRVSTPFMVMILGQLLLQGLTAVLITNGTGFQ